jgi:hypothetical protein
MFSFSVYITWQESSQCVTEQCRSVRPSVTCVSSVLAFAHARSHSSETTTSHLFYNQQFGATIRLSATTRRAIPTLYGVLPGIRTLNLLIICTLVLPGSTLPRWGRVGSRLPRRVPLPLSFLCLTFVWRICS